MYQALYRKYRPRNFGDVTGQQHITETLRAQIESDRLSHAYLFVGTRGTGKTTCAKILSRAANCLQPVSGEPCNKCASCVGIENGSILDVMEIDAASNNSVEDVRAMREEAVYSPASVKKRVFILDEAHMLTGSASNALLKTLEEPPSHIIFILATTEMHKVPATIQSRCQKFSFRRLSVDEIASRLTKIAQDEGLTLTADAAGKLAMLADGSMRDGVSLLDQCAVGRAIDIECVQDLLGLASKDELGNLVRKIAQRDILAALNILDDLYKDGKDMAALASELLGIMRDLLIAGLDPDSSLMSSGLTGSELADISKQLENERLLGCLDIMKDALVSLPRAGASRLVLEMCIARMCSDGIGAKPSAEAKPAQNAQPSAAPAPKPVAESKPAITPKPEPAPTQEHAPTASQTRHSPAPHNSDNILSKILGNISDKPLRALLNDSSKVRAAYTDGRLTVIMKDEFNANVVRNSFMDAFKEAAAKSLGRDVMIIVETEKNGTGEGVKSKLDSLMLFGDIVKTK